MSDYQEFRRRSLRRKMWKRVRRTLLVVVLIAALAGGGWFALRKLGVLGQTKPQSQPQSVPGASSEAAPAPTPEPQNDLATAHADADWNRLDYAVRMLNETVQGQDDGTTAMDYRLAGLPGGTGTVELSYFDSVTFCGDSLTQGLQIYETGLPNAHYCAYKSQGPQAFVNGTECKTVRGTTEIPMEALVASAPNQVYILLGTNVLVRDSAYDGFLAYYGQMLDLIHEALPNTTVYVQSLTPVRPEVRQKSPGLYKERLQRINDELAALALQKGCYFLNLWEALADENGDLRADIAQADGIHLRPDGYTLWVDYLRTHTAYTPGVMYVPGTSYYIER